MYIIAILGILAIVYVLYSFKISPEKETIDRLRRKLKIVDPLFETISIHKNSESYTNKETIYLCMYSADGKLYSDNTLIRVLLHEMAHVRIPFPDPDHKSPEFKEKEEQYLKTATALGLYDPKIAFPCNYCSNKNRYCAMSH